jgi:hypothetical protein
MSDPLIPLLAALPAAESDAARAARTRARCRARLARQASRTHVAERAGQRGALASIWPTLIAALGAAYLADAIVVAFRFYTRG